MHYGKSAVTIFVLALTLVGCSQPDGDWIDVPLTEKTFFDTEGDYRIKEFEVLVLNQSSREFMLAIDEGDAITYEWSADSEAPEQLIAEFHGHTEREGDEPGEVMFYNKHQEGREAGALVAPFDGIHGWYLKNDSDKDITVTLTVAGFFDVIE